MGKPVLVLRKKTERPEGVDAGTVKLVGTEQNESEAKQVLTTAVAQANLAQEKGKGGAREAIKLRDAKLDALADWPADFIAIAKTALDENSQRLEKLGLGTVN